MRGNAEANLGRAVPLQSPQGMQELADLSHQEALKRSPQLPKTILRNESGLSARVSQAAGSGFRNISQKP